MRTLKTLPNPVLRQPCAPVDKFDKILNTLYLDMLSIMHAKGGVGIAAPQVGVSRKFVIVEGTPMANPQIIGVSEGTNRAYEGCLSIPGEQVFVKRYDSLTVEYQDLSGKTIQSVFSGFSARVVQHEIDHINSTLIVDRVQD